MVIGNNACDRLWLIPENPDYPPIEIGENMELHIWGVVFGA
jgi:DNA polymerase V